MEIRPARSDAEAERAFDVSMASFYPDTVVVDEFRRHMHFKWFRDPSYSPDNVFIVTDGSTLHGGMRLISRTMNRLTESYRMLGIAETFVLPPFRGKGLARQLTEAALKRGKNGRYDLLTIVARKAIDGFYLPFGIFGFGSYPKAVFSSLTSPFCRPSNQFTFSGAFEERSMRTAYEFAYADCFGAFARDDDHWAYLLGRTKADPGVHILGVLKQGACVGYLVHSGNTILELALDEGVSYAGLIVDFHSYLASRSPSPISEIVFRASRDHKLFFEEPGCDTTFSYRECHYGGHVLKVLDVESCLEKFNAFSRCTATRERLLEAGKLAPAQKSPNGHGSGASELDYDRTACLLGIARAFPRRHDNPDALFWSISPLDEF